MHALLNQLVDDAGLFPPAALSMDDALANHHRARTGPHAWMLGRFLCPASRLAELAAAHTGGPLHVGVVVDVATWDVPDERLVVETVEAPLGTPVPDDPRLFTEVPVIGRSAAAVAADVASVPHGAKVRCGGTRGDLFPAPGELAGFVSACREHGRPFKATAGLHHPFRHIDPVTGFHHHGFLNLLAAAALADVDPAEVLADDDPASFEFGGTGLAWRGKWATDRGLFRAYGSCSFDEPVEDLVKLGVLPA